MKNFLEEAGAVAVEMQRHFLQLLDLSNMSEKELTEYREASPYSITELYYYYRKYGQLPHPNTPSGL